MSKDGAGGTCSGNNSERNSLDIRKKLPENPFKSSETTDKIHIVDYVRKLENEILDLKVKNAILEKTLEETNEDLRELIEIQNKVKYLLNSYHL